MTKQECAIVQAYTGTVMLMGDDSKYFYRYAEHLLGRPLMTHEIPDVLDEIQEKSTYDFLSLCRNAFDFDEVVKDLMNEYDLAAEK